jgi:nitroimidazol reductase NimA-like FMN-containing flavoprotein (pyridoxamine 5'-phosphate oxidase superfamily)
MAKRKTSRLSKDAAEVVRLERVCRVATAGSAGMPHVVPVCHVLLDGKLYFGSGNDARKVLNLAANPRLAATIDVYTEDWKRLRGVLLQGSARLITRGPAFRKARRLLYEKYPQYPEQAALDESDSMIVELTPTSVFTWGFD